MCVRTRTPTTGAVATVILSRAKNLDNASSTTTAVPSQPQNRVPQILS